MKCAACLFSGEVPLDGGLVAIYSPIPGYGLSAQGGDIANPAFSQALTAEEADLDLSLIEPASGVWACNAR